MNYRDKAIHCVKDTILPMQKFLFDKMNCVERFITSKITKIESSVSSLRYDAIREFADKIK